MREVLEGLVERSLQSGKPPAHRAGWEAALRGAPCPPALVYLWRCYQRLRRRKGGNGFGVNPIEWPDIDAFKRRARVSLSPWEIEVLEELDDLYLAAHAKPDTSIPDSDA